jgi:oligopeptide/dipeptide ABC transporter ATP-binding protein
MSDQLMLIDRVQRHYAVGGMFSDSRGAKVRAVDGVTFELNEGDTFGLVGESGSGKSTTARLILRLETPTAGRVSYLGTDIHQLRGSELRAYRRSVQAVFQDPWSSLNPRMRVKSIVSEPLEVLGGLNTRALADRVERVLDAVGLDSSLGQSYPHEFSGGMRQRVAVARALVTSPRLIVLDEPVSALDVSIRAQIMNLLGDLQADEGIAYLLIAHDLATVRHLCDQVAAMYLGQIVEMGSANAVLGEPKHPYTIALVSASTTTKEVDRQSRIILKGDLPSPIHPPDGCHFHTRCWLYDAMGRPERCTSESPTLEPVAEGHVSACHFSNEAARSQPVNISGSIDRTMGTTQDGEHA